MRIMSVFTSFGGLEKTGGFAQTIVMSNNPKVDDPWRQGLCPFPSLASSLRLKKAQGFHSPSRFCCSRTALTPWPQVHMDAIFNVG